MLELEFLKPAIKASGHRLLLTPKNGQQGPIWCWLQKGQWSECERFQSHSFHGRVHWLLRRGADFFNTGRQQQPTTKQKFLKKIERKPLRHITDFTVCSYPVWIKNALGTVLRVMDVILSTVHWKSGLAYLDGIVIFWKSLEARATRLDPTLSFWLLYETEGVQCILQHHHLSESCHSQWTTGYFTTHHRHDFAA